METQRFCVYNLAQESFLSLEVAAVDTTALPVRKLIDAIATIQSGTGLWLRPYRGIPLVSGLPLFDLIYLDEELRVVQQVELYPHPGATQFRKQVASALALPAHTIFASQTHPGDQLAICTSTEMEQRLQNLSRPDTPVSVPVAMVSESQAVREEPALPPLSPDQSRHVQNAIQQLRQRNAETMGLKKDSWKTRLRRWLLGDYPDRRTNKRLPLPDLFAFYWIGAVPHACYIGNISETGLFLLTQRRPLLGTQILVTLQRTDTGGAFLGDAITVQTKVVRWAADGIGVSFVFVPASVAEAGERRPQTWADQKALEGFLWRMGQLEHEK